MKKAYLIVEVYGEDDLVEAKVREFLGMWKSSRRANLLAGEQPDVLMVHVELAARDLSEEIVQLRASRSLTISEMIHGDKDCVPTECGAQNNPGRGS